MARVAMPSFDEPPPLIRESRQRPSAARFGGAKGVGARVPISGVVPQKPVQKQSANREGLQPQTRGYPQEDACRNIALLPQPAIDMDPACPTLCTQCNLPIGDHCYNCHDGRGEVHGECMAQLMLQRFTEEDNKRNQADENEKAERRKDFGIGWKHDRIPCNALLQPKFGDDAALEAMNCVVLNEDGQTISLGTTCEPLASVNLEYLSIALKVRRKEGGEPLFSLDPVKPKDVTNEEVTKQDSQMKRFEPEWLAGTSAGEVLFQADYHLKELSMGECDQPIVGMKSCLDYLYYEDGKKSNQKWSGREWFMVRKAELQVSEDGVLIPLVKMGVEAREQICYNGTMLDAPITRSDHPMVKYADSFTKNFDLIAERSSVIYHLRELAKASVLAKFLVESGIHVDEVLFRLAGQTDEACSLEIPQLWNERLHSKILVKNGEIQDQGKSPDGHAIYGGVQFGLDKFVLSAKPVKLPKAPISAISAGLAKFAPVSRAAVKLPTAPAALDVFSLVAAPKVPGLGAPLSTDKFTGMPGQLQAVSRLRAPISPELERLMITRPTLMTAKPPRPLADLTALGPAEIPSALQQLRVAPQIPEAILPPTAVGVPAVPGVPRPGVAPLARAAPTVARRQLLAGGVLARQPIPTTVSTAAITQPTARISIAPEPTAISVAMPPLGAMASGMPVGRAAGTVAASLAGMPVGRLPQGVDLNLTGFPSHQPQGVDLNLNQFSLDTVENLSSVDGKWMCEPRDEFAIAAMAKAFWSSVDANDSTAFEDEEDLALFKTVFNPNLSDRRADGDCFTTPDTSIGYIGKLYTLVQVEEEIREQRKSHFFSTSFQYDSPGPLFPISWAPSLEVSGAQASAHVLSQGGALQACEGYKDEAEEVMKSVSPAFHKRTEEGLSFRIYRVGSLEVRTIQEHDGEEMVGAVFKVGAEGHTTTKAGATRCARGCERILKATEYVQKVQKCDLSDTNAFHYYIVFETECGNTILSEQLTDGSVTWEENVKDLEVRNGLAKVIRFADCNMGITVQDMKVYCGQVLQSCQELRGKHGRAYATSAYTVAVGGPQVLMRSA